MRTETVDLSTVRPASRAEAGMRPAKIYMILCPSFHGATLLSLVLCNHSRLYSLGDTIPPRSFLSNRCGCGETFIACPFWQRVRAVVGDDDETDLIPTRPRITRWEPLNTALVIGLSLAAVRLGVAAPRGAFARANERFLQVCSEFAEFDVFIDGYKSLSRYVALKAARFPIAGVIHLIRDPLSFAASAKRSRLPIENAARQWAQLHRAIPVITRWAGERVFRIRYEDLCAQPDRELDNLQSWMGLSAEDLKRPIEKDVHWIGNVSMINFDGQIRMPNAGIDLTPEERRIVHRITSKRAREFGYV